jgi:LuxR family maltose regulon positive regulatory protein
MPEPDVLVTKVTVPPLRSRLLHRAHLLATLDQSRSSPLTLLSAPAGFGKTTLLSTWAGQSTARVAWLTLDEQDNDPTRFWTYVIAALRRCDAPVGEATLALLHAQHPPLLTGALTLLINELAALAHDIALILDDYHLISAPAIHDSLRFLLDHLPSCLHLLIAGRGDPPLPLARLRARGQLIELREPDLRLNGDEAATFLAEVMGLALAHDVIGHLEARTEGWIAGLQLAALSLRRHHDLSVLMTAFAGSHRFVLDYVQQEILAPLPEARQRFLLQISVLDRINADLCRALTGDPSSQTILESVERANLFLLPLDEERRWYRFHTLFREVLLARLHATLPGEVARLHREAALWYIRQDSLDEAIPHALATRDFSFAASLLEDSVEPLYLQGKLNTLLTWVKHLPDDVLHAHPRLATSYILLFNMLFPFSQQQQETRDHLSRLRTGVEQRLQESDPTSLPLAERDRLRRRLAILEGWDLVARALSDGNAEQLHGLAEQWQHLPSDDDAMWQVYQLAPFSMAWRMAGNFPPMVAALQDSRRLLQRTRQRYQESQILWGLITALIASGRLRQARDHCQELRRLVDSLGGPLPVAAYPDLFQAQVSYAWNQLEDARRAAQAAIAQTASLQYMDILIPAYEVLARVCIAQGDLAGAEQAVRAAEGVQQAAGIPLFRPRLESLWVQLWLARGDLQQAARWAEQCSYRHEDPAYSREGAYLALASVYIARRQYSQATSLLATLLRGAERVSRVESMISIMALQVAALQASGATHEALPVLQRLLSLAQPEAYLRVFLDAGEPMRLAVQAWLATDQQALSPLPAAHAQSVCAAFAAARPRAMPYQDARQQDRQAAPRAMTAQPVPQVPASQPCTSPITPRAAPPLPEPLTAREQEVLRLLAEGAPNKEIARQLVVSLATVKKHVANILGKLGVENRTQAIARARALSLL